MEPTTLVWLKRDLRTADHAPLAAASRSGRPALVVYVWEPEVMQALDFSAVHGRFIRQSLDALRAELDRWNIPLYEVQGPLPDVWEDLRRYQPVGRLLSHQETGNGITFARDLRVKRWARHAGIEWQEYLQNAVQRGRKAREGWRMDWQTYMEQPQAAWMPESWVAATAPAEWLERWQPQLPEAWSVPHPDFQPGGSAYGQRYLQSFVQSRIERYVPCLSRPEEARRACSRLSPYLAWGCLSTRQVVQTAVLEAPKGRNRSQFISRMVWRDHFIQKLETEPEYELRNINAAFDAIRTDVNPAWVEAWAQGQTGFPLVDACMRSLAATGYLNFRMRALLVSFLTHHLWQPWQAGVHHLARLFLDYEPGIHYPQFQMQAGTIGAHLIRTYNPTRNAERYDAAGVFIARWVPEVSMLPVPLRFEPWRVTPLEGAYLGFRPGRDYPAPIIDLHARAAYAREHLWRLKNSPEARRHARAYLARHSHASIPQSAMEARTLEDDNED
jgi:deoxyribodipyrimidine photo-lyase